jgi:hypothetical protein
VRKAEAAVQFFESPAHTTVGPKIETDPLGETGMGGITPDSRREGKMHPARKGAIRVNKALLRREEKAARLTGLTIGKQDPIEIELPRSSRLPLGEPLSVACHPRIHLTIFEVLSEGALPSPHFLEVGVDHEELPATHLGRHGKTAGSATLRTGKGPSLFLKLGHDVGQVLIIELERFPMQEPGLLGEREVQAKPAHLPHRSDLPKDPGQLGHERSRLGIIQMGDHDRDPEAIVCW